MRPPPKARRVASGAGGGGYLAPPWTGMAQSQCGPCEPRPAQGDVGDRELSHRGARRPRRALRGLRAHAHRLQLLPQPALSQVPGRSRQGMARNGGFRTPADSARRTACMRPASETLHKSGHAPSLCGHSCDGGGGKLVHDESSPFGDYEGRNVRTHRFSLIRRGQAHELRLKLLVAVPKSA
jgi:hypothetical protein